MECALIRAFYHEDPKRLTLPAYLSRLKQFRKVWRLLNPRQATDSIDGLLDAMEEENEDD